MNTKAADKTEDRKITPEELELRRAVARALWMSDRIAAKPDDFPAFQDLRQDYMKRANRFLRTAAHVGLSLTHDPKAAHQPERQGKPDDPTPS